MPTNPTSSNSSNPACSSASTTPALIDLLRAHLFDQFEWAGTEFFAPVEIRPLAFGHEFGIWHRTAGILIGKNWYSWTPINLPLIPTHASNPKFLSIIVKAHRKAMVRTGEDCLWLRPYPQK